MSYVYGFRVRSEILKQWSTAAAFFRQHKDDNHAPVVTFGPYKRKGKTQPSYTTRGCLCESRARIVCPHLWREAFLELGFHSAEGMTGSEFTNKLQQAVGKCLSPDDLGYVRDWTSHVFRRGSAVDILQTKGVAAMMKHGEWGSEAAAHSYATLDEIDTQKLRAACCSMVDLSDDE